MKIILSNQITIIIVVVKFFQLDLIKMESKYSNGRQIIKIKLCFSNSYFSGGGYYNEKGEKIKKWIDL